MQKLIRSFDFWRACKVLVIFRFTVFFVAAFHPITSPHVWRQVSTLGVSLRYWLRWRFADAGGWALLPAVLESGLHRGIMPMEFPILSLLGAPGFAFGVDIGRVVAHVVLWSAVLGLFVFSLRVWRGKIIGGVSAEKITWLIPITSFAIPFLTKFMPDFLAMLFVWTALGMAWTRQRRVLPASLAAVGMLMKPTAAVLIGIAFIEKRESTWVKTLWQCAVWAVPSLVVAALYYTLGIAYLETLRDSTAIFTVAARQPLISLVQFLSAGDSLASLFAYHFIAPFALFVLAFMHMVCVRQDGAVPVKTWCLVLLQLVSVGILDGDHAFQHVYYFIGCGPAIALLLAQTVDAKLSPAALQKTLQSIVFVLIAIRVGEASYGDLAGYWRTDANAALFAECRQLRNATSAVPWNRGEAFMSSDERYPLLGICFGERTRADHAKFGFFYRNELPAGCTELRASEHFLVAQCSR